jgi:hypothetical protein
VEEHTPAAVAEQSHQAAPALVVAVPVAAGTTNE